MITSDIYEWPKNPLGDKLRQLEESFTCPICCDFLDNPQSLKCGHSFCSICINKHLDRRINPQTFEKCPECKEKGYSQDLRRDRVLSVAVLKFKESRSGILELARTNASIDSKVQDHSAKSRTTGRVSSDDDVIFKKFHQKSFHQFSKLKAKQELELLCKGSKAKINLDGNVDDLERRHRDLVHLFNAQVDSLTPKTKTECVKELMAAETKCAQLESRERSTAKLLGALKEGQPCPDADAHFKKMVKDLQAQKKRAKVRHDLVHSNSSSTSSSHRHEYPVVENKTAVDTSDLNQAGIATCRSAIKTAHSAERGKNDLDHDVVDVCLESEEQSSDGSGDVAYQESGDWLVTVSERAKRPFFMNRKTGIGQFAIPDEFRPPIAAVASGAGASRASRRPARQPTPAGNDDGDDGDVVFVFDKTPASQSSNLKHSVLPSASQESTRASRSRSRAQMQAQGVASILHCDTGDRLSQQRRRGIVAGEAYGYESGVITGGADGVEEGIAPTRADGDKQATAANATGHDNCEVEEVVSVECVAQGGDSEDVPLGQPDQWSEASDSRAMGYPTGHRSSQQTQFSQDDKVAGWSLSLSPLQSQPEFGLSQTEDQEAPTQSYETAGESEISDNCDVACTTTTMTAATATTAQDQEVIDIASPLCRDQAIGETVTTAAGPALEEEDEDREWSCPRCTFANHAAVFACEMCDAPSGRRKSIRAPHGPLLGLASQAHSQSQVPFLSAVSNSKRPRSTGHGNSRSSYGAGGGNSGASSSKQRKR